MGWAQITIVVLLAMGLGMAAAKHGEPKGNWSFGWQLFAAALEIWLLYSGGFFA